MSPPRCVHGNLWSDCRSCGTSPGHVPTTDAAIGRELFRRLGKRNKMLLARRDERTVQHLLGDLSAVTRALVLTMCDRYATVNPEKEKR